MERTGSSCSGNVIGIVVSLQLTVSLTVFGLHKLTTSYPDHYKCFLLGNKS